MAEQTIGLQVVTPMGSFYHQEISQVIFNTTEGEMGVLPGHEPITAILDIGKLQIFESKEKKKVAAVTGGFVIVSADEGIRIFADTAEWPEQIDIVRAEASKERAEKRLRTQQANINIARAEASLRRALLRLDVAKNDRY